MRHRTDRRIVVVTDRRIVTGAYGRSFLCGLAARQQLLKRKEPLPRCVNASLAGRSEGCYLARGGSALPESDGTRGANAHRVG
jgi:hypothetical protein